VLRVLAKVLIDPIATLLIQLAEYGHARGIAILGVALDIAQIVALKRFLAGNSHAAKASHR